MSHSYLVEIDHSVVGMIVLEAAGYRFYATKPALSSLHSHLFDTADQAHYAILDKNGRSTDTRSSLTPLYKAQSGSGDVPESNAAEMAQLQSSKHIPDALLSHYQAIGLSAVVAALNAIAGSVRSESSLDGDKAEIKEPEFLRSDQVAA